MSGINYLCCIFIQIKNQLDITGSEMIQNMKTKIQIVVQNNVKQSKEVTDDKEVKVNKEVVKELVLNNMEQEEHVVKVKQDKEKEEKTLGLRVWELKVKEAKRVLEMEDLFYVVHVLKGNQSKIELDLDFEQV